VSQRFFPNRAFPATPFIPGVGKRPPDPELVAPMLHSQRWMANAPYLWGVDLFNAGYFWEAHEMWEAAWHAAPDETQKSFMQALVQYAAGMLKFTSGPVKTAAVLAERSLGRLNNVRTEVDHPYMGCDLGEIIKTVERMFHGEVVKQPEAQLDLQLRSRDFLGALTDRWVQPKGTSYLERDGYQLADTPDRREYYGGHSLVLDKAPDPADIESWFERWQDERGELPGTSRYLVWETLPDAPAWVAPELADGTIYERILTMVRTGYIEPKPTPDGIAIRRMSNAVDWQKLVDFTVDLGVEEHGETYGDFGRWRFEQYRDSLRRCGGGWWGAFDDDHLVAALGLFESPSLCRYQEVQTRASHRKRGIATALIGRALASSQNRFPKATSIICPVEGADAERIYKRLGFETASVGHWVMRSAGTK